MKKILWSALLVATAAFCPAPIKDGRPLVVTPEQSQAQLEQQQRYNGAFGQVGDVPIRTEPRYEEQVTRDGDAAKVLATAGSGSVVRPEDADEAVKKAAAIAKGKAGAAKSPWMVIVVLAAIIGVGVLAFRQWAARTIPEPGEFMRRPVTDSPSPSKAKW